jgi:formimidoylglutamate deiminase
LRRQADSFARVANRLTIPGFVNAHSHAFQRALRGRTEGGDFWAWRDAMLELADRQTSERVRTDYEPVYREMRAAGYTAVGEFHYLGFEQALAAAEAAQAAGVTFVLLYAAYARGGLERFRQASPTEYLNQVENLRGRGIDVGLAPHSVRACPPSWLAQIGNYAAEHELVLHVHANEQPREVEESIEEHGIRPIELLAKSGCLGPRTTIVHGTHADDAELDLLAQSGSRICVCPTTEANLGDGYFPVERVLEREVPICIGSDSNARIDPLEELRELEGIGRRSALRRNVIAPDDLLRIGADGGAAALGLDSWPDAEVDLEHRSLVGLDEPDIRPALVFGCSADVFV